MLIKLIFNSNSIVILLIKLTLVTCQSLQPCVFEYNSTLTSQGEIFSPNYPGLYPNNLNCRYEFYGRDNELIVLKVEDFQLESAQSTAIQEVNFLDLVETVTRSNLNPVETAAIVNQDSDNSFAVRQCFYDFLDIFTVDKQSRTQTWRSRHCGQIIDQRIVSTSPNLILVFQTDRMLNYRGFKFRFHFSNLNIFPLVTQLICGASQVEGAGGILTSPNYPMVYPANAECAWVISVESQQTILIKFDDVNLNQRCKNSFIRIYDGYVNDVNKPDLNVCEKLKYYHKGIQNYYSKTNRVVINFVANKAVGKEAKYESEEQTKVEITGFKLTWTAVHLEEQCDGFRCKGGEYCIDEKNFLCQQTYKYCIAKDLVCDGQFNCDIGDKSDELYCQLVIFKPEFYYILFTALVLLFIAITLMCYLKSKIRRRNYMHRIRNKNKSSDELDPDNIECEYNPHKKIMSMPAPNFIDFNILKDNDAIKKDMGLKTTNESDSQEQIENELTRLKSTRNSLDFNRNEIVPIKYKPNRQFIVRQTSAIDNKAGWLNQNKQQRERSLVHQNSLPTNSSSLTSIKSDSQQSFDLEITDNSSTTDKMKTKTDANTLPVKIRNKPNERNYSNNSLRRNSYTKAIFFENY